MGGRGAAGRRGGGRQQNSSWCALGKRAREGTGEQRWAVGGGGGWRMAEVAGGRTRSPQEWTVAVRKAVMEAKVWARALYFLAGLNEYINRRVDL